MTFTKERISEELKASTQNASGMFEINEDTICAMMELLESRADAEPDGWKLVPVEPTKEMIDAGWSYYMTTKSPSSLGVYGAMLAAAPQQEVE